MVQSLDTLKRIFHCDFSGTMFRFWTNDHKSLGWRIPQLRKAYIWCRIWKFWDSRCWEDLVHKYCLLHQHIVVKSVRPRLRPLEQLMGHVTKLLVIVRDPRGSMTSRGNLHWCTGDCDSIKVRFYISRWKLSDCIKPVTK